ncbi:hypothetical protein CROQUDRAFT_58104 [Cronartium quercuum f. sp. fusiforme G11]|uniref:Wax synthase domain-containing protein n=1 Tax=Cronartium quercuum f. sp. fusiforme G11 TaxID=708437 RepID=A0A9P6NVW2_9BASI|nr:hypothetical protein CROQUDRAFT_58104 [Cronartium quercuum f. sp. fusiforme G11]
MSTLLQSRIFSYAFIAVWLVQAAWLHPYYEPNETYRTWRLAIAPLIIYLALTTQSTRLLQPLEDFMIINYSVVAIPTFHIVCSVIQYAFHRGPVLKSDGGRKQKSEPVFQTVSKPTKSESANPTCSDSTQVVKNSQKFKSSSKATIAGKLAKVKASKLTTSDWAIRDKGGNPPSWAELTKWSLGLALSPRCLEYTWAPPASVLSRGPRKSVTWFVLEEVVRLINHQIFLIFCGIFALPATQHPSGVHGYLTEVYGIPDSAGLRYISPYLLMGTYGAIALHALSLIGSFWNLVEVVWFTLASRLLPKEWAPRKFDTTLYPTLFNNPNFRTSLTEFWGKGWHCIFRRDFMHAGAGPAAKLASPLGKKASSLAGVLGAMLMSGIMHEWGLIAIWPEMDYTFQTTKFFFMCGVGMVIEQIFQVITGYKVSGNLGRIWLAGWIAWWSRGLMRVWLARGIGKSGIRTPCEYTDWSWARYSIPLGPMLPDRILDFFSFSYA